MLNAAGLLQPPPSSHAITFELDAVDIALGFSCRCARCGRRFRTAIDYLESGECPGARRCGCPEKFHGRGCVACHDTGEIPPPTHVPETCTACQRDGKDRTTR